MGQDLRLTVRSRILVVDDQVDIREPLAMYLQRYGLEVATAADGVAMRDRLEREHFDLILLDVMMPGEDGLSLCRYVHEHRQIPVILLTAMDDPADRVAGLELGADDYVVKPFDPRELVARIRSLLRRISLLENTRRSQSVAMQKCYCFDGWLLDIGRQALLDQSGQQVELSTTEFRILRILVENPHKVFSREKLLDLTCRQDGEVFDRSIDTQISRLRKKLKDSARQPRLLRTAWGDGYLLAVDVKTANA